MPPEPALRIAALQTHHAGTLAANLDEAARMIQEAAAAGARLVVLPEYFAATGSEGPDAGTANRITDFLRDASRDQNVAVVGNVVRDEDGALRNVGLAYDQGKLLHAQAKIHPMPREAAAGITGGTALRAFDVGAVSTGILVCADILFPEAASTLALQGAELLLNPVMSPYRPDDETKAAREALYIARAWDAAAFVVKAGGHRRGAPSVAGRSLVTAPWGIVAHYKDEFASEVLLADLDMARLDAFRKDKARFPARAPSAYHVPSDR